MSLLQTQNLSCHFGGIKAVDNVNFTLNTGEIRAIIGPNGAGKSTFVSMLCGRQRPTDGRILLNSTDITDVSADKRTALGIAYTFQITSVFNQLSCYENVELAVQGRLMRQGGSRLTRQRLRDETCRQLERVGLVDYETTLATHLSYGHQRLLELAMGLSLDPEILMLDEPTQGFAESEIDQFGLLIKQIALDATVLLIEHNMNVVMSLANSITVLDQGRILAEGTPEDIASNAAVQTAYLGTD